MHCIAFFERKSSFLINEWMNEWLSYFVPSWWFKCNSRQQLNWKASICQKKYSIKYNVQLWFVCKDQCQFHMVSSVSFPLSYVYVCGTSSWFYKNAHAIIYITILKGFAWSRIIRQKYTRTRRSSHVRRNGRLINWMNNFPHIINWFVHW